MDDVFWLTIVNPPRDCPDYPRLTLDGLLLSRARLVSRCVPQEQEKIIEQDISKIELYRSLWNGLGKEGE